MRIDPHFLTEVGARSKAPMDCYITRCLVAVRAWEKCMARLTDEQQQGQEFDVRLLCGDRTAHILYRWNPGFQRGVPGELRWS